MAHDIMEKRGKSESQAIQIAIGVIKRWARGGGNVDSGTRAAAAKAVAEWERMKGSSKVQASLEPSIADELALRDAALGRLAVFEAEFGLDAIPILLAEGMLQEAAAWTPTLKRTASASSELERHEVHDAGQHVGTISRRASYSRNEPDRFAAHAVNGERVTDYSGTSREKALEALRKHLEEAPARVGKHANGKWLVARPASYSGADTYAAFPSQSAARYAAGLPEKVTAPEQASQVAKLGEMLEFDLATVSGLDIPALRYVQEACRLDPFDMIAEAFSAAELRDFHGRWRVGGHHAHLTPRDVSSRSTRTGRPKSDAVRRYEGGVVRPSARARQAHAAKPQIALADLPGSVGRGVWSRGAERAHRDIAAGRVADTEHAHRVAGPGGQLGGYSAERTALHQEIIRKLFQGKAQHEGKARAIFTAGGPASGKSGLIKAATTGFEHKIAKGSPIRVPSDVVHVNPDVVREMLPEYQSLKAAGNKQASSLTHEEASHVSKLAMALALKRQHHVLVDTVGDSGPGKFAAKIQAAQRAGHATSVHYATVPVAEALKRAEARFQKTGRSVPADYLRQTHAEVSQRFTNEIQHLRGVHVQVFDTTGPPRLLGERLPKADKLGIVDQGGLRGFIQKGGG